MSPSESCSSKSSEFSLLGTNGKVVFDAVADDVGEGDLDFKVGIIGHEREESKSINGKRVSSSWR